MQLLRRRAYPTTTRSSEDKLSCLSMIGACLHGLDDHLLATDSPSEHVADLTPDRHVYQIESG